MNTLQQILFSALHNAAAAAAGTVLPVVVTYLSVGPQGNALAYAQAHPPVLALWTVGALVARDLLKNIPPFGAVASTGSK